MERAPESEPINPSTLVEEFQKVEQPQSKNEKCKIQEKEEEEEFVLWFTPKKTEAANGHSSVNEIHAELRGDTPSPKHHPLEELMEQVDKSIFGVPLFVWNQETNVLLKARAPLGTAAGGRVPVAVYDRGNYHKDSKGLNEFSVGKDPVSVKIIRIDAEDYNNLKMETEKNILVPNHPNIIEIKHTFIHNRSHFCVVFPYMNLGSLRNIMTSLFEDGLPELCVAVALKEALRGLSRIHESGQVHREISAGHIFVNKNCMIRLAFAATVFEDEKDLLAPHRVSICKWAAAPEVYDSENNEYTPKADIWLIGITALELAYGHRFRIRSRKALVSMVEKIHEKQRLPMKNPEESPDKRHDQNEEEFIFPTATAPNQRDFSWLFEKMVKRCLAMEPADRPTAADLLKYKILRTSNLLHFYEKVVETYTRTK